MRKTAVPVAFFAQTEPEAALMQLEARSSEFSL
jgi:hypothetical protein